MQFPNQIVNPINYSETWNILFLSIALLGIYLSAIVLGFKRVRKAQGVLLGYYTATISILLLSLSTQLNTMPLLNGILNSAGLAALFLVGPFSYYLFLNKGENLRTYAFYIQLLPAIAVIFISGFESVPHFWFYLAGIIFAGIYLIGQLIRISKDRWKKIYTLLQLASFVGICIVCLSSPASTCSLLSSICLVLLILLIWIRLLYTAYNSYLINQS